MLLDALTSNVDTLQQVNFLIFVLSVDGGLPNSVGPSRIKELARGECSPLVPYSGTKYEIMVAEKACGRRTEIRRPPMMRYSNGL